MKQNKNELDVDFIGGHAPLTEEEAKAISAYIKAQKARQSTPTRQSTKRSQKREKVTA